MDGLFDDLIPASARKPQNQGVFDDLIPQQQHEDEQPAEAKSMFGDLVPLPEEDHGFWHELKNGSMAGIRSIAESAVQTAQLATGKQPDAPAPVPEGEKAMAAPFDFPSMPDKDTLGKTAYHLASGAVGSLPEMAGGAAGAAAGAATPIPGGTIIGAGLGAGGVHAFRQIAPNFALELQATPNDQDGAWERAVKKTVIGSATTAAAFAAFGIKPFEGELKNLAFQAFGLQPAIAETEKGATNVMEGKPVTEDMGSTYAETALGTIAPYAAMRPFHGKGGAKPQEEPPPVEGAPPGNKLTPPAREYASPLPEFIKGAEAPLAEGMSVSSPSNEGGKINTPQTFRIDDPAAYGMDLDGLPPERAAASLRAAQDTETAAADLRRTLADPALVEPSIAAKHQLPELKVPDHETKIEPPPEPSQRSNENRVEPTPTGAGEGAGPQSGEHGQEGDGRIPAPIEGVRGQAAKGAQIQPVAGGGGRDAEAAIAEPARVGQPGEPGLEAAANSEVALTPKAAATPGRPQSFLEWLAGAKYGDRRGMFDDSGELKARDAVNYFVPGKGKPFTLNKERGISPDDVRKLAIGEGFLPESASVDDVYNLIDHELAGRKQYRPEEGTHAKEAKDARMGAYRADLDRHADGYGIDHSNLSDQELERHLTEHKVQEDEADRWQHLDTEAIEQELEGANNAGHGTDRTGPETVPGIEDESTGRGRRQDEAAPRPEGRIEGSEGGRQGAQDHGGTQRHGEEPDTRESVETGTPDERARAESALTEKIETVEGKRDQFVLPGAERSARQAAAARGEKIKPKSSQEDAGGMFAEPDRQSGLFEEDPAIVRLIKRGDEAVAKVLAEQRDIPHAMRRPETGPITFRWGDDKGGFAKIVQKHGEKTARDVPEVIARGEVQGPRSTDKGRERLDIVLGDKRVVLALDHHGQRETWVLTSFERERSPAEVTGPISRQSEPMHSDAVGASRQVGARTDENIGAKSGGNKAPEAPENADKSGFKPSERGSVELPTIKELNDVVEKHAPELLDVVANAKMALNPGAVGSDAAKATAKDFANAMRRIRYEWNRLDRLVSRRFSPDRRRVMWEAADEQSVLEQQGKKTNGKGLDRLTPDERAVVKQLQDNARATFEIARKLGMIEGEGLPSYVPRYLIDMATGRAPKSESGANALDSIGGNLKTTTRNLLNRKHLTVEETERAGRKATDNQNVAVVRDIRTLAMATAKLQDAIAGRTLVNKIREIGRQTGDNTVAEGGIPSPTTYRWFTIDTPALKSWRPRMKDGKPLKDENGEMVFDKVPIYIRGDFEGPLRAVLSQKEGALYRGLMDLKARTMGVIMYSPLIHNGVEWGRAIPAMPGKVASFKIYFEGNAAKKDLAQMHEAIDAGMVPIGARFGFQDISSIQNEPDITPGRSWTAKIASALPGLVDERAGNWTKRAVDKLGDVWHNTLLWDRVGDLQMGLYTNFRDALVKKGFDPLTSQRLAAHMANRYAGALPTEAMSNGARKLANLALFSRTFTLGNLGAMKDALVGLPSDVQAQIMRDAGNLALKNANSFMRKKSSAMVAMDIGLSYLANSIFSSAVSVMFGNTSLKDEGFGYLERLQAMLQHGKEDPLDLLNPLNVFANLLSLTPMSENEPGKENRIYVGRAADGSAIYMRVPFGKVGEDLQNWVTKPLETLKAKLSTFTRPVLETVTNDKGFGRKVYNPYDHTSGSTVRTIGAIVKNIVGEQLPVEALDAIKNRILGEGDSRINDAKLYGPLAGVTFSKGAPGGPEMGEYYRGKDEHDTKVKMAMPEIRSKIKAGDRAGAIADMTALGIPPSTQASYMRSTLHPRQAPSPQQLARMSRYATPDQMARIRTAGEREVARRQDR